MEIGLQNEEGHPHKGTLNYASPTVDCTTGTLTARAILDNPNRVIGLIGASHNFDAG